MAAAEEDLQPPGSEEELVENNIQAQDDFGQENVLQAQNAGSSGQEEGDLNNVVEKQSKREKRSRSHRERSSKHGRSHRKHHSSRHSKRSSREEIMYNEDFGYSREESESRRRTRADNDKDAEDGEILEDGEIASDDGDDPRINAALRNSHDRDNEEGNLEDEALLPPSVELEGENEDSKPRRDKRKRKDRHKDKDDKKAKKPRPRYVDHDQVDEGGGGKWPADDNPYSPSKRHDIFNYSGDSPPGLYDSPSNSEDELAGQPSLASLVSEDFLDANVAANEREHFKMQRGKPRDRSERKRASKMRRKGDSGRHYESSKKKLVEIPMADRPVCRFFLDGKCAKGSGCPFNHDVMVKKKADCCRHYKLAGICPKGDTCAYMHEDFPCRYYHTGQTCFSNDNCRFSHDPLTDETRKIVEMMMRPNFREESMLMNMEDRHKKPSLLGSPPQHVKEMVHAERVANAERVYGMMGKKIPSLFDIEVFPTQKPTGFYSEIGDISSPPREGSPPPNQPNVSPSPGSSLLGTPPHGANSLNQGTMLPGSQGPGNRPMMGPQHPIFGMNPNMQQVMNQNIQQAMNQTMQQAMNQNLQQGMNQNMQQGMNLGMQQGMNPNMQGMNQNVQQQGMNPNMQQGMNPNLQQGMNPNMQQQGMNANMQQGMNPNMQQGMNQNMQQGMNPGMQQGMNPGMQQGNMQQGMNPGMQPGNMQQGMNPGMQPGNMQQGMNPGMQQGMNPNMQQGMGPRMNQGMNPNMQGMNLNQNMLQRMQNAGMNPGMMQQGMNPNMRGMNMNRMMGPNMAGMGPGGPRFGPQSTPSMPPVLNMISALLRGATGGGGVVGNMPFNQNADQPLQQNPNQAGPLPQDTDLRVTGDTDMRTGDTDMRRAPGSEGSPPPGVTGGEGTGGDPPQETSPDSSNAEPSSDNVASVASNPEADGAPASVADSVSKVEGGEGAEGGTGRQSPGSQLQTGPSERTEDQEGEKGEPDASEQAKSRQDNASPSSGSKPEAEEEEGAGDKSPGEQAGEEEIPLHLPPMQRKLFMRLRQQQHEQQPEKEEEKQAAGSPPAAEKKMAEDDDWYSSDEEESVVSKKKITDILKTISSSSAPSTSAGESQPSAPTLLSSSSSSSSSSSASSSSINVMQMIQSIRNQAHTTQAATPGSGKAPQQTTASASSVTPLSPSRDPRQRGDPRSPVAVPAASSLLLPPLPTLFVDPPVTSGMPKKTVVYRMTPLSARAVKPYWTLPPSVDVDDSERKKDPRVQAHIALVAKRGPEVRPPGAPSPRISDPRLGRSFSVDDASPGGSSPRPLDPRTRRLAGNDPRSGASPDQRVPSAGPQDPRAQGGVRPDPQNQNMGGMDPRGQNMGRPDPRLQQSSEPWMGGNNMGPGGMMGVNMMQGPNAKMVPPFQNNMMQGGRGMPGQPDMWNNPMRMGNPMNMNMQQQGPMGMHQGPMNMHANMGMNQGNMPGGPMGMQGGAMNMQAGAMNMPGGPMNMQGGPMNMQAGTMGMQDPRRGPLNVPGHMNMQQGNMGMQHPGNMAMPQQGNMNMQQGNMMGMQPPANINMQHGGNLGMPQGNLNMPPGNRGMQQPGMQGNRLGPMGNPGMMANADPRQGPMNVQSDPRQTSDTNSEDRPNPSIQRSSSDPRQRGRGDPREGRFPGIDPRKPDIRNSTLGSPGSSPLINERTVSPDLPLPEDSIPPKPQLSDSDLPHRLGGDVDKDSVESSRAPSRFLPPALREPPSRSDSDPGASNEGSASDDSSTVKKRFDYRNDPRFKRKRASETKVEKPVVEENVISAEKAKQMMGQRKSTMEYTSPLGGGNDSGVSASGYGSYTRPPPTRLDPRKKKSVVPGTVSETPFELPRMELPPLLSQQPPPLPDNMAPPEMMPDEPEQQLKDIFKTIDPTASPFC